MGKFTDKLEKWAQERDKQQEKRRQDTSVVEFLAVKKDVNEAIEAGYSRKTIWEYLTHDGKLTSSYETFRRYVKRFIKETEQQPTLAAKKNDGSSLEKGEADSDVVERLEPKDSKKIPGTSGFKFDAKPNREDLI